MLRIHAAIFFGQFSGDATHDLVRKLLERASRSFMGKGGSEKSFPTDI